MWVPAGALVLPKMLYPKVKGCGFGVRKKTAVTLKKGY
jgi:hypothetical protein